MNNLNKFYLFLVLSSCLLIGACSPALNTRITTFKDPGAASLSGTVAIMPFNTDKDGSLEFSWFAEPLEQKLEGLGFRVVENSASADYLVDLDYGVNRREADSRNNDRVYVSSGFGSWRSGTSIGFVIDGDNDPRYEYERVLQLRLRKNTGETPANDSKLKSLIEVSAISVGRCELIQPVYPAMLDAVFKDFYRANGSTIEVKDKLPANHCKVPPESAPAKD